MPPKHRFSKDKIIAAALDLVRKNGLPALTARSLGAELGTSSHPIFTAFRNMEELHEEVKKAARALYNEYMEKGLSQKIASKGAGMQYIKFAKEEPRLFELLFMTAGKTDHSLEDILPAIDDNSESILSALEKLYDLPREIAFRLYQEIWIFTHGMACLCVTGLSRFTDEQAGELMTEVFKSILIKLKSEGN